jgi:ABC-type transport system involved in multi-copper enzyme maturation permease subunit
VKELIGIELFKLRKRRMTWILLGVLVAFCCIQFLASYLVVVTAPSEIPPDVITSLRTNLQFPDAFTMIFSAAQGIGTILLIILTASIVGSEYGWGTVRQTLMRRGDRLSYIGAKVVALIVVILIGLVISLVVGMPLASFTTFKLSGSLSWGFLTPSLAWDVVQMFWRTFFVLMPYLLLAALFAVVGRSALTGIAGGLGYYFGEGIVISIVTQAGGWPAKVADYFLGHNVAAIMSFNQLSQTATNSGIGFGSSTPLPGALHATVAIVLYCLLFATLSIYLFRRQDLTP